MLKPIPSGVYEVNKHMTDALINCVVEHASNLGAIIANELACEIGNIKSLIADPVVAAALTDVASISGYSKIVRVSTFHALNQKAIAKLYAKEIGKNYNELNLIVAHLGGGTVCMFVCVCVCGSGLCHIVGTKTCSYTHNVGGFLPCRHKLVPIT